MPRWIRFISCALTGLVLTLFGFLLTAYLAEGRARYWHKLVDFMATPPFWYLAGLIALLSTVGLLLARVVVNTSRLTDSAAGFLTGGVTALVYAVFLISTHARDWGGAIQGIQRLWPSWALFTLPFALSGAFTSWLWERLD